MATPVLKEVTRQYRVAKQTLAMHSDLRDWYSWLGFTVEVILLAFTAIVSATTFSGDDFFKSMRVTPDTGRLVLGIASVVAFAGSLVLLVLNPRGKSATHADAATLWTSVVFRFRALRTEDDTWPTDAMKKLAAAYAKACKTAAPIPDRKFNKLKARYLRKVEISQIKDSYPGCPIVVLGTLCGLRDTYAAIKWFRSGSSNRGQEHASSPENQHASADGCVSNGP